MSSLRLQEKLSWYDFCFTKLSILISNSLNYIMMAVLTFAVYSFLISERAVLGSKVIPLQNMELEGSFSSALARLIS